MKKILVILLVLAYGVSSSGATLHIHYCCGKIDKIDLTPANKNNCPLNKSMKAKGCCDNKEVELKIKDDYQKETELKTWIKQFQDGKFLLGSFIAEAAFSQADTFLYTDISPPVSISVLLHILYCTYLI